MKNGRPRLTREDRQAPDIHIHPTELCKAATTRTAVVQWDSQGARVGARTGRSVSEPAQNEPLPRVDVAPDDRWRGGPGGSEL